MRISTLSAENVKCPVIRHDLSAVNVIIGKNYAYKSARLEAIRLGLLGYVPGLPKTNAGVFSLSCGSTMSVKLQLTDRTLIERSYTQKGASITANENIVEAKPTYTFSVPPVLMDAG